MLCTEGNLSAWTRKSVHQCQELVVILPVARIVVDIHSEQAGVNCSSGLIKQHRDRRLEEPFDTGYSVSQKQHSWRVFSESLLGPSGKQSWYTIRRKELCNVGGQGR